MPIRIEADPEVSPYMSNLEQIKAIIASQTRKNVLIGAGIMALIGIAKKKNPVFYAAIGSIVAFAGSKLYYQKYLVDERESEI